MGARTIDGSGAGSNTGGSSGSGDGVLVSVQLACRHKLHLATILHPISQQQQQWHERMQQ